MWSESNGAYMREKECYYTSWDIFRLAKDKPEEFLELINKFLTDKKYDEVVKIIKKSGIAINKFGGGKSNDKVYKKIHKELSDIKGVLSIDKFLVDVETINRLYKIFYENHMTPLEECIPPEHQFSSLIINLQLRMESLALLGAEGSAIDITSGALETLVFYATAVIKFFYFKKYSLNNIPVTENILNCSNMHFESVNIHKSLDDINILWSLYGLRLYTNHWGQITFDLEESKDIFAKVSGHLTYLDIKNNKMARQGLERFLQSKKNGYIDDAAELINEYYNIDDINQRIDGIPLIEYIKAYKTVNELGLSFVQDVKKTNEYTVQNYLIVIRDYKVKKRMLKEGVSSENVDYLLEFLTFSAKDSVDLYDTPLLKMGKNYIIVPFIARTIEPAAAIFSNFNSRDIELNVKGDNFEQKIKDILSKSNVKYKSYKRNLSKEEFQCDLVFKLDDTIYFCEIKHFKPPLTFWDYAVAKDKLYKATLQLNRIYDFFSSAKQWEEIMKDFQISPNDLNIKKRRLIVTNILMDSKYTFNNVNVTTEYKLYTYFNQIKPAIHQGKFGQMKTIELNVFKAQKSSEISSHDFEKYIKEDILMELNKNRFVVKSTYYEDLNLLNNEYSLDVGTFTKLK